MRGTAASRASRAWRTTSFFAATSRPRNTPSWPHPWRSGGNPTRHASAAELRSEGTHTMSHLLTLHDPAVAREHYLSGVWQTDTFYSLARGHATERGGLYALRDSARRLTWSALVAWADAVAADLHDAGLRRGNRVSVWMPNRLENAVIKLACSRNGYV